jgi:hypothetical protein
VWVLDDLHKELELKVKLLLSHYVVKNSEKLLQSLVTL